MTELTGEKKISRKVQAFNRGRQIVVTLKDRMLEVSLAGTREKYTVCYESILNLGAQIEADRQRRWR